MIRCSSMLLLHPRPSFKFKPPHLNSPSFGIELKPSSLNLKLKRQNCCRAVFADDAPFAAAIGACMLTSLVLPVYIPPEEEEAAITSTDSRLAVMGIISFIPYFNWLVSPKSHSLSILLLTQFLLLQVSILIELGFCVA